MRYQDCYQSWQADSEKFWMEQAKQIAWFVEPSKALFDENAPIYEWFSDGVTNSCYNAVDRHVIAGHGDRIAVIYDSPLTGVKRKISYAQLQEQTAKLGGALQARGIKKGDRVIIYMPMIVEALIAMLACARIGAIHSVVFGGFAATELATRINDAKPKAILSASHGIEPGRVIAYQPLLTNAVEIADHKPQFCVMLTRAEAQFLSSEETNLTSENPTAFYDWHEFQRDAKPAKCEPLKGNDPLYILYTSGTTGQPKGVVRHNGGHMVALQWTMKNIYNVQAGEVFWAASDVGWVVGHSYIVYGPLFNGNTTIIYEGKPVGTPDAGAFWRMIEEYDIKVLFTAPTAFRAIKRDDPEGFLLKNYNLKGLRALYLAGERADPATIMWAQDKLKVPVVDHWWQTETGYAIVANPLGLEAMPMKLGSPSVPMPGYQVEILDETGQVLKAGQLGAIAIKLPLPPGTLPTLWNAEARYRKAYLSRFPGYYETGDAGYIDEDGYVYIMARTDDVINVAGHRLSTGAMEEVLAGHPDVAECAVIGVGDALKGQLPLGFLCLNNGSKRSEVEVAREVIQLVREKIGPVAAFKLAVVVNRLPKTRSGKILRATMAHIADGTDWKMPATIDDPTVLDEIKRALQTLGYAK